MMLFIMLPNMVIRNLPDALIGEGRYTATTAEIMALTGADADAVRHGLARLRHQGRVFTPARSLHVMVPPEYRSWRAIPAPWFIDAMMRHLGRGYYVALLTAAAHHGASHQAAQVFQVITDRHVGNRDFGRIRLRFYRSALVSQAPTESVNSPTGTMAVSTREATVVDLVERPGESGGLNNVATIICEIGALNGVKLADLSALRPRAHARRLGWLLDHLRDDVDLDRLRGFAMPGKSKPTLLGASGPSRGAVDRDWGIRVNADVEPDLR
jgi:predicted transcriptional regulator of viral defense system